MTSEIRANTLKNRVGLGTISFTTTGAIVSGIVTANSFSGPIVGDVTGAASQITVADESSDTTCNPVFVTSTSGNLEPKTGTNLVFNSASGNLRTGSLFLGQTTNESKTQDGLILERNSVDGEVHITAGRSGGNYNGFQFHIAGASGVTKRLQMSYDGLLRYYAADGSTERLRITSDGKIGISRTPTQHPLEIQHASEPTVSLWRGSTKGAALQAQSGGTYLYSYENAPLIFSVNSSSGFTERLRITSGGNIGVAGVTGTDFSLLDGMVINTANGSAGLLINSSSSSHNAYLGFSYGSGSSTSHADQFSAYIGRVGDNTLTLGTNNNIRWYVSSSGHFYPASNNTYDIGTTSNGVRNIYTNDLIVTGTGVVGDFKSTNNNYVLGLAGNNSSVKSYVGTDSSGNLLIATGSGVSQRLRIGTTGIIGINNNGNRTLHVQTSSDHGNIGVFAGENINSSNAATMFFLSTYRDESSGEYFMQFNKDQDNNSGGVQAVYRVNTRGDVQNKYNSYSSTSDVKLKENIVDANSQWDDIKAIKVRNFNFKTDPGTKLLGVVAQEIENVSAGLVEDTPDKDITKEGDEGTTTKSVKYSILYMKAIKCLQEAQARIETLESKVATLEGS